MMANSARSYALIYAPRGASFTLNKSLIKGEQRREIWYARVMASGI